MNSDHLQLDVAIETASSLAGIICNERRYRLVDNVFEALLMAKANKDLLNEAGLVDGRRAAF